MGIKLYAALELRGEYDARIHTIEQCLPENRGRGYRDDGTENPSEDFDIEVARKELASLEFRRRKLNTAIQRANFENVIVFGGQEISITEALETRKALNGDIGRLHGHVVRSSHYKVVHKEERDIEERSSLSYTDCNDRLDQARKDFRQINRLLREASHVVEVDFQDEQ